MLILSIMNRRSFLKSIGAAGLLPALPIPSFAAAATTATAPVVSAHTYQWAEMIVRAHNKCNLGMLQRLLQLDSTTAAVVKNKLLENGIISAQANAYGMHTAVKPLYESAFMNVSDTAKSTVERVANLADEESEESAEPEKNESEINTLEEVDESEFESDPSSEEHESSEDKEDKEVSKPDDSA